MHFLIDSGKAEITVDQKWLQFSHLTDSTVSLITDRRASS
jgi:hypothetical protein